MELEITDLSPKQLILFHAINGLMYAYNNKNVELPDGMLREVVSDALMASSTFMEREEVLPVLEAVRIVSGVEISLGEPMASRKTN